jgi:exosortase
LDEAARIEPRGFRIRATHVAALCLTIGFGLAFSQLFIYYWQQWTKDHSPFGFGYLVPPTVAFLLWCKRKSIAKAEVRSGSAWILLLAAFAAFVAMVGILSVFNLLQSLAFLILLMAVPYYLWGREVYARIWGPLAFTATMIPWPDQLTAILLLPSQLLSTKLAAGMLNGLGLGASMEATMVYLPNYQFEVAKACSGLTILFPVVAIAILNCMMVEAAMWRKVGVLLLAVPISMVANALRIAIIGIIGNAGGSGLAESLHDSSGLFGVFIAIILLSLVQWWLKCLSYHPDFMPSFGRDGESKEEER